MLESLLHKFYAASITITGDGSMLVASNRDRLMMWGMTFCLLASFSLILYLATSKTKLKNIYLFTFCITLLIPIFIIPSVKKEYIHVSPEQIYVDNGAWYKSSKKVYTLNNLDHIKEVSNGIIPANLIGDRDVNWHFSWKDGTSEIMDLNDFFNAHRMVVSYYITDRGMIVKRLSKNNY